LKPLTSTTQSKVNKLVGVGLRHPHYDAALTNSALNDEIDFIEIHAENFFAAGGISQALLKDIAQKYKISVHGTSLGLGSSTSLPHNTLQQFAQVVHNSNAFLVSEHLCFNRIQTSEGLFHSGDLLPLAYNTQSLNTLSTNIQQVQDTLKRSILIENLSAYIAAADIDENVHDSMSEVSFLSALCKQSGCGLLLDLNNLIVNALNQGIQDPVQSIYNTIKSLPANTIGEIHLAGFSEQALNGFIVDDHANFVSQQCWELYSMLMATIGPKPSLVEWDNNLPQWHELVGEATKAKRIMCAKHSV